MHIFFVQNGFISICYIPKIFHEFAFGVDLIVVLAMKIKEKVQKLLFM